MTIFDIATQDAIINKDNTWFIRLLAISKGEYHEDEIPDYKTQYREIYNLNEICSILSNNKIVYYEDPRDGQIKVVDPIFTDMVNESTYRFSIERSMDIGVLKFFTVI